MLLKSVFAFAGVISVARCGSFSEKIKHIIAIMFENRSFDHMLGFMSNERSDIDGCLPSLDYCSNPLNELYPNDNLVYVGSDAVYVQPGDPSHSVSGTREEIFGNSSIYANTEIYPPPMSGFVTNYAHEEIGTNPDGSIIMQCFNKTSLPILNTLANEFAVFDRWFSDIPGPTDPNRLYSWLTTSAGMAANDDNRLILGFPEMSIFEMVDRYIAKDIKNATKNETWRLYFEQVPSAAYVEYVRFFPSKWHFITDLFVDIRNNDLPFFSWVDPSYADLVDFAASDEHPDHDVTKGESILKKIYEELAKSDAFNDTLLIIFYDEHGGFFDHVPPPHTVNPDNKTAYDVDPPFNFDRYGVRVPTVMVSPWIAKGTVAERPELGINIPQYSHSSIVHTVREQYAPDCPPFTKRDEYSVTFENILNLDSPRTDYPKTLPNVPSSKDDYKKIKDFFTMGRQDTNDFHRSLALAVSSLCNFNTTNIDSILVDEDTVGTFYLQCMEKFLAKPDVKAKH